MTEARNDSDLELLIEAGPARTPFFPDGFPADLEDELGRPVAAGACRWREPWRGRSYHQ
jgi:predicted nucleotidyltransferase